MTTTTAHSPLTVFSDEEQLFREAVSGFANDEVRPRVQAMERASRIDPDLLPKYFELGLMGIEVPEQFGGAGGSLTMVAIAVEEISKVDASAAIVCDVQNTLVNYPIVRYGNDDQRARFLPRLVGDTIGAYALSEPGSGSDAFGLATRAEKHGDRYVLTGRKMWITNGAEAQVYVVFANTNPAVGYKGITAFMVERGFAGFGVGKK
jgi:alkylation response protein AidB-like acyl-CoA dehydrogenase